MQGMLKDRFHLKVHHEMRGFHAYNLVLAKGRVEVEEKISLDACGVGAIPSARPARRGSVPIRNIAITEPSQSAGLKGCSTSDSRIAAGRGVTMANLAVWLQGELKGAVVIDKTGLDGKYDYRFEFSPIDVGTAGEFSLRASSRRRKDLGLKLEPFPRPNSTA